MSELLSQGARDVRRVAQPGPQEELDTGCVLAGAGQVQGCVETEATRTWSRTPQQLPKTKLLPLRRFCISVISPCALACTGPEHFPF